MKLNRVLAIVLAITLAFSSIIVAHANEKPQVSVQNGIVGYKDETITVPVAVSGNNGIMGYRINVSYDKEKLEVVSVKNALPVSSNFNDSIKGNDGSFFVIWNATENTAENGTLFNISFKVLSDADEISEIAVSYSQPDTFDEKFNDVELECHNGFVILNSSNHSFVSRQVEPSCTEEGYTIYECNECDLFYKTDIVAPIGHDFGVNKKSCVNCGQPNPNYDDSKDENGNQKSTSDDTAKKDAENAIVNNKTTKIKKIIKKQSKIVVKWKSVSGINGYQIQYSTKKSFSKKTTKKITVKGAKKATRTIKKLKHKKKYFIRIRTYKTVNGVKYYSKWSKAKAVNTK